MEQNGYAWFVRHPRTIEDLRRPHPVSQEREYRIVNQVSLNKIDYENFIYDLLVDRKFIERSNISETIGGISECILVKKKSGYEGVLIIPERECYVGWAAYISWE